MNTSRLMQLALAPALLALLGGCAAVRGADHRHDAASGRHDGMGGPQGRMDMQQMCEMHKQMMAGRPPAERESMMQDRMRSMSPEMRQQMQDMMANCR